MNYFAVFKFFVEQVCQKEASKQLKRER